MLSGILVKALGAQIIVIWISANGRFGSLADILPILPQRLLAGSNRTFSSRRIDEFFSQVPEYLLSPLADIQIKQITAK